MPEVARAFKKFLQDGSVNVLECWVSADPHDLPKGPDFPKKILAAIDEAHICVALLNHESLKNWWVNFETGVFYGHEKPVHGLLCCGLSHTHIQAKGHPLGSNGTNFIYPNEADLLSFFISVLDEARKKTGSQLLTDDQLKLNVGASFKNFIAIYNNYCGNLPSIDMDELLSNIED